MFVILTFPRSMIMTVGLTRVTAFGITKMTVIDGLRREGAVCS